MATCRRYRDGKLAEEGFDPTQVSEHLAEDGGVVWVDLEDPTPADRVMLAEEFGFHETVVEDVAHRNQRAKLDEFDDYLFLAIRPLLRVGKELREQEVHAFVGPRYLITLRYSASDGDGSTPAFELGPTLRRVAEKPSYTEHGPLGLLYFLLDEVTDDYFELAEWLEDEGDEVEDEVFVQKGDEVQKRIFDLKRQVVRLRRDVQPLRVIVDRLQELDRMPHALSLYYRDVEDHLIRTTDLVDNARELLTTALEAHRAEVGNRLNEVMKELTAWASIILVPTLIAGIYGMNFRHMPELNWLFGYPFALGLMLLSGGLLWRTFRRRGWL